MSTDLSSPFDLADDFFVPPADELVDVGDGGGYIEGALGGLFDDEPPTEHAASEPPAELATAEQREEAQPTAAPSPSPEINADPHTPSAWQQHTTECAEWFGRHRDAEHNLCVAALELAAARERVKSLSETLKKLTDQLAEVQREEPKSSEKMSVVLWTSRPVSEIVPAAAIPTSSTTASDTGPSAEQAVLADDLDNPDPNAWRSVPIVQLKLKPSIEAKLLESGVSTIGQLEDLRADDGAGGSGKSGLRSIKGVGQAKADAIEDAIIAWLSANRDEEIFKGKDFCGPPIGDPEKGGDGESKPEPEQEQAPAAEITEPAKVVASTPSAAAVEEETPSSPSPMMQQYLDAKTACPDCLLLFRMGDFYELHGDDARIVGKVLDLPVGSRTKGHPPICGFPCHRLDGYLAKLIAAGHRAAICDQAETVEVVVSTTVDDSPATLPHPSLSCSSTLPTAIVDDPDAQRAAAIEDRASELIHQQRSAEEATDGEEPLEPRCDTDRWWAGGVEAFDRGDRLIDCPIEPVGSAECDDWLRGWLTAKLDDEERQKAVGDVS